VSAVIATLRSQVRTAALDTPSSVIFNVTTTCEHSFRYPAIACIRIAPLENPSISRLEQHSLKVLGVNWKNTKDRENDSNSGYWEFLIHDGSPLSIGLVDALLGAFIVHLRRK
jgi:hypothetical protein